MITLDKHAPPMMGERLKKWIQLPDHPLTLTFENDSVLKIYDDGHWEILLPDGKRWPIA